MQLMMRCLTDIYCTPTLPLLLQKKIENTHSTALLSLGFTVPKLSWLLLEVSPAILRAEL